MHHFWSNIIRPIIERIDANYIIEIGSDTGINTKNILEYCVDHNGHMTAIDPSPKFDVDEFKVKYGDKFEIYLELSLSRLPLLNDYDVILIDGDHNWYTVYNELKIIEKNFKNKKFPLVFLHDIGWPYARRDLYYNPENIPEIYRQPYKKLGMHPDQTDLIKTGGLNTHLYNSIYENNPQNGVLTAIEDFIGESDLNFSFKIINIFFGLGILFPKNDEIENVTNKIINNTDLLSIAEEERVKQSINYLESKFAHDKSKKTLENLYETQKTMEYELESSKELLQIKELHIESMTDKLKQSENKLKKTENQLKQSENKLKKTENQLKQSENKLKKTENQLKQSENKLKKTENQLKQSENQQKFFNESIMKKDILIATMEKREKEVSEEFNNLKTQFYEMEYQNNKNRSITQRLISKFPSLYILSNMNKTGVKNALTNIKGYKTIKKNKLFDVGYYLKCNSDIRQSGMDPLLHYIYHGFKEGRNPNTTFNNSYYLKTYPDVKNLNLNPLIHYSLYGITEGRKTNKNSKMNSFKNKHE